MAQQTPRDIIREAVRGDVVLVMGSYPQDDYVRALHSKRIEIGGQELEIDCVLDIWDLDLAEVIAGRTRDPEIVQALMDWQQTQGLEIVVERAAEKVEAAEASLRG
jgi:hypothetical protein